MELRTISRIKRLKNSNNGNPRFRFYFDDETSALLKSNAAFGYQVGNPGLREGDTVNVQFSSNGAVEFMRTTSEASK